MKYQFVDAFAEKGYSDDDYYDACYAVDPEDGPEPEFFPEMVQDGSDWEPPGGRPCKDWKDDCHHGPRIVVRRGSYSEEGEKSENHDDGSRIC